MKQCMLVVTEELCPHKEKTSGDISLSDRDCARRTEELEMGLSEQIKMKDK